MREDRDNNPIIARIQREAGIPELINILTERLDPTDMQSLLLEVYRRRAARINPSHLLDRYEHDKFTRPSSLAPSLMMDVDRLAWSLLPDLYEAIELSPLCPLGANAALATVDQNKVVTTIRNTEVMADSTNALALECALRRRLFLRHSSRSRERVRLCASHRLVRGQAYGSASARAHFRLLGLCAAGRDEGSYRFETTTLVEQISYFLRLLQETAQLGYRIGQVRVTITSLREDRLEHVLDENVLKPVRAAYPDVRCAFDPDRETGRGYYIVACFHVYATNMAGAEYQLVDGGFTTWTQQLLSNNKERLLISGLGTELLCRHFNTTLTESV